MGEKSKYLLKIGVFWAILMAAITTALEAWEKGDFGIFLSSKFALKMVIFFFVGVFVGHFNWKEKLKANK